MKPSNAPRARIEVERRHDGDLARLRAEARRGFVSHLIPYLCVNAMFVLINVATTKFPWALIPILGWGIGLLLHLLAVLSPNPEQLERRLAREQERRRRKALKRDLAHSAKEFETAVGQGVAALLKVAAEKVQEGTGSFQSRQGERVRVDEPEQDVADQADWQSRESTASRERRRGP
ncbi:MAG: 2TM domain-containing protein [Polyangiaceae bacterium]